MTLLVARVDDEEEEDVAGIAGIPADDATDAEDDDIIDPPIGIPGGGDSDV